MDTFADAVTHWKGSHDDWILRLSADSRKLPLPKHSIFFALHGPWHDGHNHLKEAHAAGVRRFVVSNAPTPEEDWCATSDVVVVPDVLSVMQSMAQRQRMQFKGPVIAVTGSNGKTVTKEWLAQIIPSHLAIHRSPLSHNSQLGVPLSLWSLDGHHELSLMEAGISKPGEMAHLAACIQPTEGVLTHLGDAHLGNFQDRAHLASEKCQLFASCSRVFMPEALRSQTQDHLQAKTITWSLNEPDSSAALKVSTVGDQGGFECFFQGQSTSLTLPFLDEASIHNALTACLVALHHGTALGELPDAVAKLHRVTGRLSSIPRPQGGTLLQDDCSHDLGSLDVALGALDATPGDQIRLAVLSDVAQSGLPPNERLERLAEMVGRSRCTHVWMWVPKWSSAWKEHFQRALSAIEPNKEVAYYDEANDLLHAASRLGRGHVLWKVDSHERQGSLVHAFAPTRHVTTLTLNASALVDNLRRLKAHAGARGVVAVVKGLGYGTDPVKVGRLLEGQGVDWLAVAYADEGVRLREAGIRSRVLVLNPDPGTFDTLHAHQLEPQMVSLAHLRLGKVWAKENNVNGWPVHLKLDTGMRRLGLTPDEDEAAVDLLKDSALNLVTVMSHLAGADDPSLDATTKNQLDSFLSRTESHYHGVPAHILNSAGTTRVNDLLDSDPPSLLRDWIRVGLSMYGLGTGALDLGLTPVLELRTVVSRLVSVPPGEGSGYGWTDAAGHARTLAVLAVGYADGYPRNLGNGRGQVHWKGRLLPTVGRVCMDMMTVDATGLDIQAGDEVLLWGEDLRLEACAEQAHTIPYEMLTRLGPRVQRVMLR
tara:strand:- start:1162 stop:3624 length:2463 start_codon:yes stop_codon:yes gene_type:complete